MRNSKFEIRPILDKNAWEIFEGDEFIGTIYRLPAEIWISLHRGVKLTSSELRHLDEFISTVSGHYCQTCS